MHRCMHRHMHRCMHRTHIRTHARTHTHTHTRLYAYTCENKYICTSQSQNILSITQREPIHIIVLTAISCFCCKQKGSLLQQLPCRTIEGGSIHIIVQTTTEGEHIYIIVLIAVSCVPCRIEGEPIHITVLTAKSCAPLHNSSRMETYSPNCRNI